MSSNTYIKNKIWQKSITILFPFVYKYKKAKHIEAPYSTYMFSYIDDVYYSIENGFLTCLFNTKKNVLDDDAHIELIKKIEDEKIIIIYKIVGKEDLINKLIQGKYSEINQLDKQHIFNYYGAKIPPIHYIENPLKDNILLDLILFPSKYYKKVAIELNIDEELLKKVKELSSFINFSEEETYEYIS